MTNREHIYNITVCSLNRYNATVYMVWGAMQKHILFAWGILHSCRFCIDNILHRLSTPFTNTNLNKCVRRNKYISSYATPMLLWYAFIRLQETNSDYIIIA